MGMLTVKMGPVTIDYAKMKRKADRAVDRATIKQLAFIRRRARTSVLRRRKSISAPGKPPSVHSKNSQASLKNIRFVYEGNGVGQVGPVKLNQVNMTVKQGNQPVPSIMESGGTILLREVKRRGSNKWRRADGRRSARPGEKRRVRPVKVKARPFMSVALKREIQAGTIMDPYANTITE